jgi:hypothetical protein
MWKHCSSVLSNFVVLLVLVALVWAGDPPWSDPRGKDKPYQQWTDEDITRLSADSPWTHPVTIERSWVAWVNKELPEGLINGGAARVDNQTFENIETYGRERGPRFANTRQQPSATTSAYRLEMRTQGFERYL